MNDEYYGPQLIWWKFYRTPHICVRTSTGRYVNFFKWPYYAIYDFLKQTPKAPPEV